MAENDNIQSVTGYESLTKRVQGWLNQAGLKPADVSKAVRKRLIQADMYLTKIENERAAALSTYADIKASISDFCDEAGITRMALYKKNSGTGESPYKLVIDNLSIEIDALDDKSTREAKRIILKDGDMNDAVRKSLLLKEAEYQDQKIKMHRQADEIKSLKEENARLKKLIKVLRNAS